MISALIVIMGIATVIVAGKEEIEIGLMACLICAVIAAILGTLEIPAILKFLYHLHFGA